MAAEQRFPGWIRYAGVGVELSAAMGGLALIGYWVDSRYGTGPWGILSGVVVGMVGGLYNLIKQSLAAVREGQAEDASTHQDSSDPDGPQGT